MSVLKGMRNIRSPPVLEGPGSDVDAKKVVLTEIADTPLPEENIKTGSKKTKVFAWRNKSVNPSTVGSSVFLERMTQTETDKVKITTTTTTTTTEQNNETNLVDFLMAESDPVLLRILLDKSKPENLSVFLKNSSISLRDFGEMIKVSVDQD